MSNYIFSALCNVINNFLTCISLRSVLCWILSKFFKEFDIEYISIFPFQIRGLKFATYASRYDPEVLCTIRDIHVSLLHSIGSFFSSEDNRLLSITIEEICVTLPAANLKLIMEPPPTKKVDDPKLLKKFTMMHYFPTIFDMSVTDMKINVNFESIKTKVTGIIGTFHLASNRDKQNLNCLIANIVMMNGYIEIVQNDVTAVQYTYLSDTAAVRATGVLDIATDLIDAFLTCEEDADAPPINHATIRVQPFLTFFQHFQDGDDHGIEVKMSRNMPPNGKLRKATAQMSRMLVTVLDERCDVSTTMGLSNLHVELLSEMFDDLSEDAAKNVRSPQEGVDVARYCGRKDLTVQVDAVEFLGCLGGCVRHVSMTNKKLISRGGLFVDLEEVAVDVRSVQMPCIDNVVLNTFLCLQHTADIIPNSKFAHFKYNSTTISVGNCAVGLKSLYMFRKKLNQFNAANEKEVFDDDIYIYSEVFDILRKKVQELKRHPRVHVSGSLSPSESSPVEAPRRMDGTCADKRIANRISSEYIDPSKYEWNTFVELTESREANRATTRSTPPLHDPSDPSDPSQAIAHVLYNPHPPVSTNLRYGHVHVSTHSSTRSTRRHQDNELLVEFQFTDILVTKHSNCSVEVLAPPSRLQAIDTETNCHSDAELLSRLKQSKFDIHFGQFDIIISNDYSQFYNKQNLFVDVTDKLNPLYAACFPSHMSGTDLAIYLFQMRYSMTRFDMDCVIQKDFLLNTVKIDTLQISETSHPVQRQYLNCHENKSELGVNRCELSTCPEDVFWPGSFSRLVDSGNGNISSNAYMLVNISKFQMTKFDDDKSTLFHMQHCKFDIGVASLSKILYSYDCIDSTQDILLARLKHVESYGQNSPSESNGPNPRESHAQTAAEPKVMSTPTKGSVALQSSDSHTTESASYKSRLSVSFDRLSVDILLYVPPTMIGSANENKPLDIPLEYHVNIESFEYNKTLYVSKMTSEFKLKSLGIVVNDLVDFELVQVDQLLFFVYQPLFNVESKSSRRADVSFNNLREIDLCYHAVETNFRINKFTMSILTLNFHPKLYLNQTLESILQQKELLSLSMQKRMIYKFFTEENSEGVPVSKVVIPVLSHEDDFSSYSVFNIANMIVNTTTVSENICYNDLCNVVVKSINIVVNNIDLDYETAQSTINSLDISGKPVDWTYKNATNTSESERGSFSHKSNHATPSAHLYDIVQGGNISCRVNTVSMYFNQRRKKFISITNLSMKGKYFLASLYEPTLVKKFHLICQLTDKCELFDDLAYTDCVPCAPKLFGSIYFSTAPPKVYSNLSMAIETVEYLNDIECNSFLQLYLVSLEDILPISYYQHTSLPLQWWDTVRYYVHAIYSGHIGNLLVLISQNISRDNFVLIENSISDLNIYYEPNLVEVIGQKFSVFTSEMVIINSKRRKLFKSQSSSIENASLNRSSSIRSSTRVESNNKLCLCYVPLIQCSFVSTGSESLLPTITMAKPGPSRWYYNHHDVYLNPVTNLKAFYFDIFHYFRLARHSLKWFVHISAKPFSHLHFKTNNGDMFKVISHIFPVNHDTSSANSSNDSYIVLFLRLAVINSILMAFSKHDDSAKVDESNGAVGSPSHVVAQVRRSLKPTLDEVQSTALLAHKHITNILSSVTYADVQFNLTNFIACSWESRENLNGIVFIQKNLSCGIVVSIPRDIYASRYTYNSQLQLCNHFQTSMAASEESRKGKGGNKVNTASREVPSHTWRLDDPELDVFVQYPTNASSHRDTLNGPVSGFVGNDCVHTFDSEEDVVHLALDTVLGEFQDMNIFIRNWNLNSLDNLPNSDVFAIEETRECKTAAEVISLFEDCYKLAHGSKVTLRYEINEDEGDVFDMRDATAKEKATLQKSVPEKNGKLNLFSFQSNHYLVQPASSALPPTYRNVRRWTLHAGQLIESSIKSAKNRRFELKEKKLFKHLPLISYNDNRPRAWCVRAIDIRILWTLTLRDILSLYVYCYFNVFGESKATDTDTKEGEGKAAKIGGQRQSLAMGVGDVSPPKHDTLFPSKVKSSDIIESKESIISSQAIAKDDDEDAMSLFYLGNSNRNAVVTNKATVPSTPNEGEWSDIRKSILLYSSKQINESGDSADLDSLPMKMPLLSQRKSSKGNAINRRKSVKDINHFSSTKRNSSSDMKLDNISEEISASATGTYITSKKEDFSTDDHKSQTMKNSNHAKFSEETINSTKKTTSTQKYIVFELEDPQLNFLCTKTQSTLLIISAGVSKLEVVKYNNVFQLPSEEDESSEAILMKRQYDCSFRMSNVKAYTTESCANGIKNIVVWKNLNNTSSDKRTPRQMGMVSSSQAQTSSKGWHGVSQSNSGGTSGRRIMLSMIDRLKIAIDDFYVYTLYTYYNTMSAAETSEVCNNLKMVADITHVSNHNELMETFMLDIPELCVKTAPSQFHIINNVIKNLLLIAPTPITKESQSVKAIDNFKPAGNDVSKSVPIAVPEEEESPDNHESSPHKLSTNVNEIAKRNMSNRFHRIELRELLDDAILAKSVTANSAITENSSENGDGAPAGPTTRAFYIEHLMSKGTWLICDELTSDVVLEIGFMGVFGSHTYHETRGITSLFEVQRFWVREVLSDGVSHGKHATSSDVKYSVGAKTLSRMKSRFQHKEPDSAFSSDKAKSSEWALTPWLLHTDSCQRCGAQFDIKDNFSDACRFHANFEGVTGEYKEFKVTPLNSASHATAPLKVEKRWTCCLSLDKDAIGCNSRPHICKELMLCIRAESEPLRVVDNIEFTIFNTLEISVFPGAIYELQCKIRTELVEIIHRFFDVVDDKDEEATRNAAAKNKGDVQAIIDAVEKPDVEEAAKIDSALTLSSKPQEGLYVKYLRIGDISISLTTDLLPIKIDSGKVFIEPFVVHGKVLDWSRLFYKFERHASWSVSRNFFNTKNSLKQIIFSKDQVSKSRISSNAPKSRANRFVNQLAKTFTPQTGDNIGTDLYRDPSGLDDDDDDTNEQRKKVMLLGRF